MPSYTKTILSILVALAMIPLAMSSCEEKPQYKPKMIESPAALKEKRIKKLAKRRMIKPKTAGMLIDFEKLFKDQERAIEAEKTAKKVEEHEVMTNVALNQTLEEFLNLDPDKDAKRVQELIEDLKEFGQPAIDALLPMVDQKLKSKQRRLLIMAIGVLKGKDSSQEVYKRATSEQDVLVRREALAALRKTSDKEALAKQSVAQIEIAQAEETEETQKDVHAHVAALGAIGGEIAVDKLVDIIRTTDDLALKRHAVIALGDTKDDAAKRILIDLFEFDAEVRVEAAMALGRFKDEDIVTMFGSTLIDATSPEEKRIAAVKGLREDNGEVARIVMLNVLRDAKQPRSVHTEAVAGLVTGFGKQGDSEIGNYVVLLEQTPVDYMPQLIQPLIAKGGDFAVDFLNSRYSRLDQMKKLHAIRVWGRVGSPHAFEIIMNKLNSERDASLRRELITAMKECRGAEVDEGLKVILSSIATGAKDDQEKIAALKYLAEVSPEEALVIAENHVAGITADRSVVLASIDILRAYGNERSVIVLMTLKSRPDAGFYEEKIEAALKAIEARSDR